MKDPVKRIVLSRFWVDDWVYHRADGSKGLITQVSFIGHPSALRYYVIFDERKGEWCDDIELTDEPFTQPAV